jgi:hypothetical protein
LETKRKKIKLALGLGKEINYSYLHLKSRKMSIAPSKYRIIPPKKILPIYVANVQRSGRIGFTIASGKHFGVDTSKTIALMMNAEDVKDDSIYGVFLTEGQKDQGYRITKNGEYHSIDAKEFFEEIGIDYSKPLSFAVSEFVELDGTRMLKFTKRTLKSETKAP